MYSLRLPCCVRDTIIGMYSSERTQNTGILCHVQLSHDSGSMLSRAHHHCALTCRDMLTLSAGALAREKRAQLPTLVAERGASSLLPELLNPRLIAAFCVCCRPGHSGPNPTIWKFPSCDQTCSIGCRRLSASTTVSPERGRRPCVFRASRASSLGLLSRPSLARPSP